jgi:hypothetical protein
LDFAMLAAVGGARMADVKPAGSSRLNIYIFVEVMAASKHRQTQQPEATWPWCPWVDLQPVRQLPDLVRPGDLFATVSEIPK